MSTEHSTFILHQGGTLSASNLPLSLKYHLDEAVPTSKCLEQPHFLQAAMEWLDCPRDKPSNAERKYHSLIMMEKTHIHGMHLPDV